MAQPTTGEWRVLGNTAIYAGDKMIAMTAVKDVPDFDERRANMEVMAAAKDLLEALTNVIEIMGPRGYQEDFPYGYEFAKATITKARRSELQTKQ